MKVLMNKIKKANKAFLTIYLITFIIYAVTYVLLAKNLINLTGIETVIRFIVIMIFGIWLIAYFLWNLINLILKRHITIAITTALTVIFIVIFSFVNYYINVIYTGIDNLAESEYVTYTSNLVVLNGTEINSDSKLGMIDSTDDVEGNELAKELIKENNLDSNEVISYSSYYEMIYDLLNKEVDGIFLSSNYRTIFSGEDFAGLENTVIALKYSKKMKNKDTNIVSNKSLTEPFTLLLLGVDSTGGGIDASSSFNGDTLMIITFNPKTLNATMFSIPRDTYVPIACNNNRYAKINSAAAYGTNCVIDTVEQFTDIDIDYYVKINFQGVVDLVEALDGIDVDVEPPTYKAFYNAYNGRVCEQDSLRQFGDHLVCMDTGMQHLNGEQALAYARCRHAYLLSDIARNKHQQQLIEAIAKKIASPSNINRIEELLNAVTTNLATNMSKNQILSFYEVIKNMISKSFNDGDFVSIQKTYLEWYGLQVKLSNNGSYTSAVGYYNDSLKAIINLMKANLGLEEKQMVKTFSFDANEEYTTKVTGQGITTGGKLEVVPSFIGAAVSTAEEWATSHNINLRKEFVDSSSPNYNASIAAGLIGSQSISQGILVNNVTELTVYINEASTANPNTGDNNNNNDNQNNGNSNQNNGNDNNQGNDQNNGNDPDEPDNNNSNDDPLDVILPSDDDKPEEE